MTQNELIYKYKLGCLKSLAELKKTHIKFLNSSVAYNYAKYGYIFGSMSYIRLVCENAFEKALMDYNENSPMKLSTFIMNRIKFEVLGEARRYQKYNSNVVQLSEDKLYMYQNLPDKNEDKTVLNDIFNDVKKMLNKEENFILQQYMDGYSYLEIANAVGRNKKYIDNKIRFIKIKLRNGLKLT
jgi:DNA-directed RNA polymerase specialized sigma24 family protein